MAGSQGTWTEEAQAEAAVQLYTLAFGHPSMASIHWWGLSDKMIWLKGGGLLNKDLNPKPVYTRLLKLIKEERMTKHLLLLTDKKGTVNFRGFYGGYEVKINQPNDSGKTVTFRLTEKDKNYYTFRL